MKNINYDEIKQLYLEFFKSKNHQVIESASLIPENDSSVLFTTAGMQPLVPYLLGEKHPYGKRLVNVQKCLRTNDLDSVGDTTHHTFFEMLGNWSLGDYFKEESINYSFEFLTKVLNIPVDKLAVTVFEGDDEIPRDEVSAKIWEKNGISKKKIVYLGKEDNFWIAGTSGPCGGDTEIFYFRGNDEVPEFFDPRDERWVEIWNNVFMEYYKNIDGKISDLIQKNVDTGMGVERITATLENVDDNYKSSVWKDVIKELEDITNLSYDGNEKSMRIIADHIRTAVFILADDATIKPSNNGRGYILRRLIRRSIRHARKLNIDINSNWDEKLAMLIISKYSKYYDELNRNKDQIINELKTEKKKFVNTLEKGLKEFYKETKNIKKISGELAFRLYDTFGFPIELTVELSNEIGLDVDIDGFEENFRRHQELSRTSSKGMFKGGLQGNSDIEIKYHTATHLLNAALKEVVSSDIHQRGSNINDERLRFDFNCDHKLTDEEKKKVEELVNSWIDNDLKVVRKYMSKKEAIESGAECMFIEKYPETVSVYNIGDVSSELCNGPHVDSTGELGKFEIVKEESSSAGIRRIKAKLH